MFRKATLLVGGSLLGFLPTGLVHAQQTPNPAAAAQNVAAPGAQADAASVEDIIVTGSRIVREGYQSPTPLSVISGEQLTTNASSNIAQFTSNLPAFSGSANSRANTVGGAQGTAGVNSLNLRALGPARTLVLLDGHRVPAVNASGIVDISTLPQSLISRIDVVTGGASAVYGSDAVAGVVNFTLDKTYKGLKGEISGGQTNYDDGRNYKISLTGGTDFAGGRGHILLAGEYVDDKGIDGNSDRKWNRQGLQMIVNPAYTPTNGQPQRLILRNVGYLTAAPGGVIVGGPLAHTAFGEGGTPYQMALGGILSEPFMQGGDWERNDIRPFAAIAPSEKRKTGFGRVSYEIADGIEAYGQMSYVRSETTADVASVFLPGSTAGAGSGGALISLDNAYLPASVRDQMVANGLSTIRVGTFNQDLGTPYQTAKRTTLVFAGGLDGKTDLLGTTWTWDAYAQRGISRIRLDLPNNISRGNFTRAVDAVYDANGNIVCRSTLTNPTNGCSPYNVMGVNVNDPDGAGVAYVHNASWQRQKVTQNVYAASISGEPFSVWAGPVSVALSFEHRKDKAVATVDAGSLIRDHIFANFTPIDGQTSVTEGSFETVVPILKGKSFMDSWDVNGAVRYTSYSLAGNVVTWKLGTTISPIPDIKLRVTRSRDIRAPNITETFSPANVTRNLVFDPFTNSTPIPNSIVIGNPNLKPEKADTLGVGVVVEPSFIPGLSASVDYWDIKIKGAISSISAANVLLLCYDGTRPDLCANITRDANNVVTDVVSQSINFALQHVRGLDFEASYRLPLDKISATLPGELSLHANATRYLKAYIDSRVAPPQDYVGENGYANPPKLSYSGTITYKVEKLFAALTVRGFSSGTQFANYIECTSSCPTSTTAHPTVNDNHLPGRTYLDTAISYDFDIGEKHRATVFFNIRNLTNLDPGLTPAQFTFNNGANAILYDVDGRVYRAGVRFAW